MPHSTESCFNPGSWGHLKVTIRPMRQGKEHHSEGFMEIRGGFTEIRGGFTCSQMVVKSVTLPFHSHM